MITKFYPKLKPQLKKLLILKAILAGMLLCFCIGYYSQKAQTIPNALRQAGEVCRKEMHKNGDFKQVHLNSCSAYILKLSQMRLDWQMLTAENSPDYAKFEKEYIQWHKKCQQARRDALNAPGEFAGGSMERAELNLRMADLVEEQIGELKKICKH